LEIGDLSLTDLLAAMLRVLAETPVTTEGVLVRPFRVTIHDKIALACRLLGQRPLLRFRQLLEQVTSRVDIVVSLLAVLELIKRRQVVVEQSEPFGDIMIRPAPGVDLAAAAAAMLAAAPGDDSTNGVEATSDMLP
jgi:segregation and condensation protein A